MKILQPTIPPQLEIPTHARTLFSEDDTITTVHLLDQDLVRLYGKNTRLTESVIEKSDLSHTTIERIDVLDCVFKACNFTASQFTESSWHVVQIDGGRCSGMQLQHSTLRNVRFSNSKLDMTNFRFSKLESVIFEDCELYDVDFYNAVLRNVSFINCTLTNVSFSAGKLTRVDLAASHIEAIKGVASLKGVTISFEQLMQLAPYFAQEAGITVR